ncbi:hypothetical protein BST86_06750 [Nonlabens agnitus]|uniref:Uncharacterized protein n=1 Tax=Nonlabens agnitus TaxID=870484 RepID=A0A2S9WTK4_9FLAO|nr:hypothetical protein BST86_06750 [Nonlabens agnitus]
MPGLILSIHDATNDFSFEIVGLKKIQSTEFLNASPATKFDKAEKVTQKEFNKLKRAFDQLSIVEKLNYGSTSTISIINSSGEDLTKQRKFNKRLEGKRVYMEQ